MKTLHDVPAGLVDHHAGRSLPPGGGLLIAIGISVLFWGILLWTMFR